MWQWISIIFLNIWMHSEKSVCWPFINFGVEFYITCSKIQIWKNYTPEKCFGPRNLQITVFAFFQHQRIREIFEFHIVKLKIESPPLLKSRVNSCCLKGSWVPPDTCASRCRLFLRLCLISKNSTHSTPIQSCGNTISQTVSTPVIFVNNTLFNSSLDYRLDLYQISQVITSFVKFTSCKLCRAFRQNNNSFVNLDW